MSPRPASNSPTREPSSSTPRLSTPSLSAVVVHWGEREPLEELLAAWPRDPRFELVVVDNGGPMDEQTGEAPQSDPKPDLELPPGCTGEVLVPGRNLGFAAGVNAGAAAARSEWLLLLNSDVVPRAGALEALVEAMKRGREATEEATDRRRLGGLVPRLESPAGESQARWQLRDLPSPGALLLHLLFLPVGDRRSEAEPTAGEAIEQPAAAALALTRKALREVGGLDEGFYPAWFEDVDLARRLRNRGFVLRYRPEIRLAHRLGASVADLGYGPFLWIYSKNLVRYLRKHHGAGWAAAARLLLPVGTALRLLLLPLRRPKRAATRGEAVRGLLGAALGSLSGWRRPHAWAVRYRAPDAAQSASQNADPADPGAHPGADSGVSSSREVPS